MVTLDEVPEAVQAVLVEFFAQQRNHLAGIQPEAVDVLEQFVLGGGKRLRPLFAWAGYTGVGGSEDPQAVLRAVSSLELIQACALLHDDIIDSSDTRRGRPTAHRTVEARHRERGWSGDSAHFGRSVAILLGDFALAWADDLVHSSGLSAAALQRVQEPWRAMRSEVIAGQLLDVSLEASGSERLEDAERVNRFKTAAYTIERPLHIGAALADALSAAYSGAPTVFSGTGGSIPLTTLLAESFPSAELMLFGVEEPLSTIHSPDESVSPDEIISIAIAEALFLLNYI